MGKRIINFNTPNPYDLLFCLGDGKPELSAEFSLGVYTK